MSDTIEDKIREVVTEELGVSDRSRVADNAKLVDDLGADELDFVELIMAIEEEFGFAITDDDAEKIKTVGDLIAHVKGKLEQKQA